MIEYLREYNAQERKAGRETERFGQVVAIDLAFELFTRIWCVAELVQAEKLHLATWASARFSGYWRVKNLLQISSPPPSSMQIYFRFFCF